MIVHEYLVCARLHVPLERRRGNQTLECRGAGMADLVRLYNFTSDNLQAQLVPQNLSHRVGNRVEAGQFVRHHRQKKSRAASNECLNASQPVRRKEVSSQHQARVCVTALGGGVSRVAVTRVDVGVDERLREVRRPRLPGREFVVHRLDMPVGLPNSQNWIVHQSEPQGEG